MSPAESVTLCIVAAGVGPDTGLDDKPVRRSSPPPGVSASRLVTLAAWAERCCTNAGGGLVVGVTAFDGEEARLVPTPFVAVTVNV